MMKTKYLATVTASLLMACAAASTGGAPGVRHDSNVITREQIAAAHVTNAYDAIETIRPNFLHSHGATTMAPVDTGLPKVYLNHQFYGDIDSLKNLEVSAIREIHYYNAMEASNRFGMGNVDGAIEVITDAQ